MLLSAFKQMLTGQSHISREIMGWCCYAVAKTFRVVTRVFVSIAMHLQMCFEWLLGCY